jgi:hypothetical protein
VNNDARFSFNLNFVYGDTLRDETTGATVAASLISNGAISLIGAQRSAVTEVSFYFIFSSLSVGGWELRFEN